jgi:hypothetical protein
MRMSSDTLQNPSSSEWQLSATSKTTKGQVDYVQVVRDALSVLEGRRYSYEEFWADWEDHDLGFRLALAEYRNVYTPLAHVLHRGGGSLGPPYTLQRTIRVTRNTLATYFKNFEARNILAKFIPLLLLIMPIKQALNPMLYELSILGFRLTRKGIDSDAIWALRRSYGAWVRGYIAFLRMFPALTRKRGAIQAKRKTADSKIVESQHVRFARILHSPII